MGHTLKKARKKVAKKKASKRKKLLKVDQTGLVKLKSIEMLIKEGFGFDDEGNLSKTGNYTVEPYALRFLGKTVKIKGGYYSSFICAGEMPSVYEFMLDGKIEKSITTKLKMVTLEEDLEFDQFGNFTAGCQSGCAKDAKIIYAHLTKIFGKKKTIKKVARKKVTKKRKN